MGKKRANTKIWTTDEDGTDWYQLVKSSLYRTDKSGRRRYLLGSTPKSADELQGGEDFLVAITDLVKKWINGKLDVGFNVVSWMREQGFDFDALSSQDRTTHAPILIALLKMLVNRAGEKDFDAKFFLHREGESMEVALADPDCDRSELEDIIYLKIGINGELVVCGCIGQSGFGNLRTHDHEELMAFWKTAGADMAPHIHQELLKCEKVMTLKRLNVDRARILGKSERARTLNMQELLLNWGLGTNQRQQKLLDARAARGLPWFASIEGCNKRPPKDGPTHGAEPRLA